MQVIVMGNGGNLSVLFLTIESGFTGFFPPKIKVFKRERERERKTGELSAHPVHP